MEKQNFDTNENDKNPQEKFDEIRKSSNDLDKSKSLDDFAKMEQEGSVAHSVNEINENTKIYVGKLEEGIFNKIPKELLESVYTSFPEGKIKVEKIEIGGKSPRETLELLYNKGVNVCGAVNNIIYDTTNEPREKGQFNEIKKQDMIFVTLSLKDMISMVEKRNGKVNYFDVLKKAKDLGLKEVPRIAGIEYAKQYNFDYSQLEKPKFNRGKDVYIASDPLMLNAYDHPATHALSSMKPTLMTLSIERPNPDLETRSWATLHTGIDTIKYDSQIEKGLEFYPELENEFLFCLDRPDTENENNKTIEEKYKLFENGAAERKLLSTMFDEKLDDEEIETRKERYQDFCKNIKNKKISSLIKDFFFQAPKAIGRVGSFARLAEVDAPTVTLNNEIIMLNEAKDAKKEDKEFLLDLLKSEYPKIFEKMKVEKE